MVVGWEGWVGKGVFKGVGDFRGMVVGIDECEEVDWEEVGGGMEKEERIEMMVSEKDEGVLVE